MLHLSVNELESLARKAALGAGLDHGHAHEAAQSLLRLMAAGLDGVPTLVRALQAWTGGASGRVTPQWEGHACRLRSAGSQPPCVLQVAPALRDFASLMGTRSHMERIEVLNIAGPGWTIGQFAAGPWPGGRTLYSFEPGGTPIRWAVRATGVEGRLIATGDVDNSGPADLMVVDSGALLETDAAGTGPERTLETDPKRLCEQGVVIDSANYDALKYYFDLTLVPDSDTSRRQGAGAGLVDSD